MRFPNWDYLGKWNDVLKYKDHLSDPFKLYLSRNDRLEILKWRASLQIWGWIPWSSTRGKQMLVVDLKQMFQKFLTASLKSIFFQLFIFQSLRSWNIKSLVVFQSLEILET